MRPASRLALCTVAILTLSRGVPQTASAQVPQTRQTTTADSSNERTKSPLLAAGLEYVIPFVGHAYAGDVGRGTAPNVARLGGAAVFVVGLVLAYEGPGQVASVTGLTLVGIGGAASIVGTGWAVVSAARTAEDHNRALRERVALAVRPQAGRIEFAILLRH